jgi:hypothetical protein
LAIPQIDSTGDLFLLSASGSWFGAGGIVYFCPELLLMMAISKYIALFRNRFYTAYYNQNVHELGLFQAENIIVLAWCW